jgi:hypothetical protein
MYPTKQVRGFKKGVCLWFATGDGAADEEGKESHITPRILPLTSWKGCGCPLGYIPLQ